MLPYLDGKPVAMSAKMLDLHKRHAQEVNGALERMLASHAKALRARTLPRDCLLRLTYDSGGGAVASLPAKQPTLERQQERWHDEEENDTVYRLAMGHKVWNLVFQGQREVMADERAIRLVEYLLKNPPDEAIHASVLENHVDGSPVIAGMGGIERQTGGGLECLVGGVVQEATGKKLMGNAGVLLKKKLQELRADADNETLPASEREAAREEIAELLQANARGGKLKGEAEQSVERVRKAIKRFIGELRKAEISKGKPNAVLRAFGDHLEQHLWIPSMGRKGRTGASGRPGCFIYEPPAGVTWKE